MVDPARSFDRAAPEYEQARPSYPAELLDVLPLPADSTVLDLGAGTGKLTRVLVQRYARVIAVEPLDGMRGILERVVPEAEALPGTAERIPAADASVDGVFAAQAFHWFATDDAVSEIARVLRPGGVFADVWNENEEPSPFPAAFRARLDELFAGPRASAEDEEREAVVARGPFGTPLRDSVRHEQVQDREAALAFLRSVSLVARLPEPERESLLAELGRLLPPGDYVFPLQAHIRWAVRE